MHIRGAPLDPSRKQCSARIRFGVVSTGIFPCSKKTHEHAAGFEKPCFEHEAKRHVVSNPAARPCVFLKHGNMPVLTTPKRILALHCFRDGSRGGPRMCKAAQTLRQNAEIESEFTYVHLVYFDEIQSPALIMIAITFAIA